MFPIRDINPSRIKPVATIVLIAVNVLVFLLWQPQGSEIDAQEFAFERAAIACEITTGAPLTIDEIRSDVCNDDPSEAPLFPDKGIYLAILVSMFLHAGFVHLASNMWFLWVFGNNVEEAFGTLRYVAFYLATGVVATLAFVLSNPDTTTPLVGASGAIAGVLGSYLVLYPAHRVLSLVVFLFVPVPAVIFLGLWFLSQFAVPDPGVAWEAHVAGFVAGVLLTLPFRRTLLARVEGLHHPYALPRL